MTTQQFPKQLIHDPRHPEREQPQKCWSPDSPIPPRVRAFGYCLDFSALLPGDLILVSPERPSIIERSIRATQGNGGYPPDDAQWTHAAVYVMDDVICEAGRSGVAITSIYKYIGNHKVRIRRNPNLTERERWALAVYALSQNNYAYNFFDVLWLFLRSFNGFWTIDSKFKRKPKRAVYCSELYADAHLKATNAALGNQAFGEATPASLSQDSLLQDVFAGWVAIN